VSTAALRVTVVGAAGRMGALTAATVAAQDDMRLAALVDARWTVGAAAGDGPSAERAAGSASPPRFATIAAALGAVEADVVVDFTVPDSVFENVQTVLEAGLAAVVGTTGLSQERVAALERVRSDNDAHLFIAPNFALGAVLLMRFAAEACRYFSAAEIVELHHSAKLDAPSGTALRTARLMRDAPGSLLATPGHEDDVATDGRRSSRGFDAGGIAIHSVRLPGLVAHQEVLFGGTGETLSIRHDSISRESFMAGVMLAVRRVRELPETVVGLEHLMA
jgi:4-hydroxy-tetrahydrodipicolinate reductase